MSAFRYRALDSSGNAVEGLHKAASRQDVISALQAKQLFVVEVTDAEQQANDRPWKWRAGAAVSLDVQALLFSQLALLLKSGLALDRALAIAADLPETLAAQSALQQIRQALRSGKSLSSAMAEQADVFTTHTINTLRAGELSGSLPECLARLAAYLQQSARMKDRLINLLIYPAVLMASIGLAVVFLMVVVVPQFESLFESLGAQLPWYTQALLAVSGFVRRFGALILLACCFVAGGAFYAHRTPSVRAAWHAWALKIPGLGQLWVKSEVSRFCASLALMLQQGVPMLSAISYSAGALQNEKMRHDVASTLGRVKSGLTLSSALSHCPWFPRMAVQMMAAGEESGKLPEMLGDIAHTYAWHTEQAGQRIQAVLVPAVTLLLTGMVGFIILAVLLPIYDLTGTLG